jgi:hypothetical protein
MSPPLLRRLLCPPLLPVLFLHMTRCPRVLPVCPPACLPCLCADALSKEIKTERGLLRYLHMLMALRGRPHLALLSTATRVRLQVRRQAG